MTPPIYIRFKDESLTEAEIKAVSNDFQQSLISVLSEPFPEKISISEAGLKRIEELFKESWNRTIKREAVSFEMWMDK